MRVLLAFLALAAPAMADQACLSQPTPACVLALAHKVALAESDDRRGVAALLVVAAAEESVVAGSGQAFLDEARARAETAEPDPVKRAVLLGDVLRGQSDALAKAPGVVAELAETLTELGAPDTSIGYALGLAQDVETLKSLIIRTEGPLRSEVALAGADALMQSASFAAAYEIGAQVSGEDMRALVDETAVILLIRQGNLAGAEAVAAMTADRLSRAESLMRVALAFARSGQIDKASDLLIRGAELGKDVTAPFFDLSVAEVAMLVGDTERAENHLARLQGTPVPPRQINRIRAIGLALAGDGAGFAALLAEADPPFLAGGWVKDSVKALLARGDADVAGFVAKLPTALQSDGLNAIGFDLARSGDLAGANAILADIRALGPDGRVHGDFRAELVRLLLANDPSGALALAVEGGDAQLLAELAGAL